MDTKINQLIHFLQEELSIPAHRIPFILQQCKNPNRLPVVLWQQKLITLGQLDRLFNWLERYLASAA
jgi:hypothetical protein